MIELIVPVYNEEESILLFYNTVKHIVPECGICFVNDGSYDKTIDVINHLCYADSTVRLVDLYYNCGQEVAIREGIETTNADAVIIMDVDLQDDPRLLPKMIELWENGYRIVHTRRISREDTLFKRVTATLFYKIVGNSEMGNYKLLDRTAVTQLLSYSYTGWFRGEALKLDGKSIVIDYHRGFRQKGYSKYTLKKMFTLAINALLYNFKVRRGNNV